MPNKVLGIGDNVVDKYVNQGIMYPGGNVLNFCAYSKMLKQDAGMITKYGDDLIADYVKHVVKRLGIDDSQSRSFYGDNGFSRVELVNKDRNFLMSNKGGVSKEKPWNFTLEDEDYIRQFSLIHTSLNSYIEQDLPQLSELHVPISFDFSVRWTDEYLAQVCPYIDFAFMSTSHLSKADREAEMKKAANLGAKIVIGTMGEKGSYALVNNSWLYEPAVVIDSVVDTMGAGDSYLTALLQKLLSLQGGTFNFFSRNIEDEVQKAMRAGAEFSASVCQMNGAFGFGTKIFEAVSPLS